MQGIGLPCAPRRPYCVVILKTTGRDNIGGVKQAIKRHDYSLKYSSTGDCQSEINRRRRGKSYSSPVWCLFGYCGKGR